MKIFLERENKNVELDFEGKASDLLKQLGLNVEEVIISQNKTIVTEDANLSNSDEVALLSVISGG